MLSDAPQESKSPMRALLILQIPASVTRKDVGAPLDHNRHALYALPFASTNDLPPEPVSLRALSNPPDADSANTTVWMETGADSEGAKDCETLHRAWLTMLASLAPEDARCCCTTAGEGLTTLLSWCFPGERQLLQDLEPYTISTPSPPDRPVSVQRVQSITPSSADFISPPIWTTVSGLLLLLLLRLNQGKTPAKAQSVPHLGQPQ